MTDRCDLVYGYLRRLHEDRSGYVFVGHGTPRLAGEKIDHPDFEERPFAIPRQVDELVAFVVDTSERQDVWITPGLSHNPIRKMERRRSLPGRFLWAEIDNHRDGLIKAVELTKGGSFTVASGRARGHLHLYVALDDLAEPTVIAEYNQRLARGVHAGQTAAVNSYLRPTGALNHKPPLLSAGAKPAVVTFAQISDGTGWSLSALDDLLPAGDNQTRAAAETYAEDLPDPLPIGVAVILADGSDAAIDRSARLFTLVVACRSGGLNPAQTVGAARCHRPSTAKYGERLDAEVARILTKLPPYRPRPQL